MECGPSLQDNLFRDALTLTIFLAFAGLTFASFLLSWLISFSNLHATGLEFPVLSVLSPHRAPAGSTGTPELAEWVDALAQVLVQQLGLAVLC